MAGEINTWSLYYRTWEISYNGASSTALRDLVAAGKKNLKSFSIRNKKATMHMRTPSTKYTMVPCEKRAETREERSDPSAFWWLRGPGGVLGGPWGVLGGSGGGSRGLFWGMSRACFLTLRKRALDGSSRGRRGVHWGGSGGALGGSLESQGLKLEPTCGAGLSKTASKFMRVAAFRLRTGHFSVHMGTWSGAYDCIRFA